MRIDTIHQAQIIYVYLVVWYYYTGLATFHGNKKNLKINNFVNSEVFLNVESDNDI